MKRRPWLWRPKHLVHSGRRLIAATEGGGAVEYGLVAALIVLAIIGAISGLGEALRDLPLSIVANAIASVF